MYNAYIFLKIFLKVYYYFLVFTKLKKKNFLETLNTVCELFKKNPFYAEQQKDYAECCTVELGT